MFLWFHKNAREMKVLRFSRLCLLWYKGTLCSVWVFPHCVDLRRHELSISNKALYYKVCNNDKISTVLNIFYKHTWPQPCVGWQKKFRMTGYIFFAKFPFWTWIEKVKVTKYEEGLFSDYSLTLFKCNVPNLNHKYPVFLSILTLEFPIYFKTQDSS